MWPSMNSLGMLRHILIGKEPPLANHRGLHDLLWWLFMCADEYLSHSRYPHGPAGRFERSYQVKFLACVEQVIWVRET
jgi:hypothetical protein